MSNQTDRGIVQNVLIVCVTAKIRDNHVRLNDEEMALLQTCDAYWMPETLAERCRAYLARNP